MSTSYGISGLATAGYGMYGGYGGYGSSGYSNSGYSNNGFANNGFANNGFANNGFGNGGNANGNNNAAPNFLGNQNQAAGQNNANAFAQANPAPAQQQAAAAAPSAPALNLPTRDWTADGGDLVIEGQYVGMLDGSVIVRKTGGKLALIAIDRLSDADRQYVAGVAGQKAAAAAAVATDSE